MHTPHRSRTFQGVKQISIRGVVHQDSVTDGNNKLHAVGLEHEVPYCVLLALSVGLPVVTTTKQEWNTPCHNNNNDTMSHWCGNPNHRTTPNTHTQHAMRNEKQNSPSPAPCTRTTRSDHCTTARMVHECSPNACPVLSGHAHPGPDSCTCQSPTSAGACLIASHHPPWRF